MMVRSLDIEESHNQKTDSKMLICAAALGKFVACINKPGVASPCRIKISASETYAIAISVTLTLRIRTPAIPTNNAMMNAKTATTLTI
ncbi:hypothetical protein D3C84_1070880 [compost metagenome]